MTVYQIDNLWELIPGCDNKVDGAVPIWDAVNCVWTVVNIPGGTMDCAGVQTCMATTIAGINTNISTNTADIISNETRISSLEGDTHNHPNMSALNGVRDDLSLQVYLGGDGAYHTMPSTTINGHTITSNGINYPARTFLEFDGTTFIVTDDVANDRTVIQSLGSGGGTPTTDDYVSSGSFAPGTNTLTLTRLLGGAVNIDLSALADTDVLVKVGAGGTGRYLNIDDFFDTGSDIEVKKQMSIVSDAAGLKLDGDVLSPGNNMIYGTNGAGVKGWVANTGVEVSVSVVGQTTYTFVHNLGKRPNIVAEDSGANWVSFGARTINANTTELTFSPAFTGDIYAN